FLSRLLGMGDIESLLERAQEAVDEEKAEELARKMMSGKFTLFEMRDQIDMLGKVGTLDKVLSMLPAGAVRVKGEEAEATQQRLRRFRVIMDSMTKDEMSDPKLVKSAHVSRIARGAGVAPRDVKDLLKHYEMSHKAIKGFAGNRKMRKQLLKQLQASGLDLGEGG
ncbi:MAG TPA: signal recognition particle protein Srp19, partial [Thermoplasmata archaeon]